jgi:hypothetical protein
MELIGQLHASMSLTTTKQLLPRDGWVTRTGSKEKLPVLPTIEPRSRDRETHESATIAVVFNLGYAKTSYRKCKIGGEGEYVLINIKKSGSDLGLATADPDVRTFH